MIRTYTVELSVLATNGTYTEPVLRTVAVGDTSNHPTTFADIPRIISVAMGAGEERVKIISCNLMSEE